MKLSPEQVAQSAEDGFLIVRKTFLPTEVSLLWRIAEVDPDLHADVGYSCDADGGASLIAVRVNDAQNEVYSAFVHCARSDPT